MLVLYFTVFKDVGAFFLCFHVLSQETLSSGRPPPKRRCLEPLTDNTSCDEPEVMDSEAEVNVTNFVML